tara:strand:+ start:230 stop:412 length:183 start_codon:yes stop_codon:yes gene_type:complete
MKINKAIEIIDNALMFYEEEAIASDKKEQKRLREAWRVLYWMARQMQNQNINNFIKKEGE